MSFLLHGLHEQQQHAPYLVYSFQDGHNMCLACLLHSLSDPGHLDSKKQFAIRFVSGEAAAAGWWLLLHLQYMQYTAVFLQATPGLNLQRMHAVL